MNSSLVIEKYLDDLDDSLEVGLARRDRILAEVGGHLEEAARARQHDGESRHEAEKRATLEFGPPERVAARFASQGTTAGGRLVVALADFFFVARNYLCERSNWRWVLKGFASMAVVCAAGGFFWSFTYPGAPGAWNLAAQALLSGVVGSAAVLLACGWQGLMLMPRPGYGRRWLKVDQPARERVLGAVRASEALSEPQEARLAAEFAARVRDFRHPDWVFFVAGVWTTQCVAGLAAGFLWTVPTVLSVALLFWAVSTYRRRSVAFGRAEGELVLFEVVDAALREASRQGVPAGVLDRHALYACGDPRQPNLLWYPMARRGISALPIGLGVGSEEVYLVTPGRTGPTTSQRKDPHQLRELRNQLAAMIVEGCREGGDALGWSPSADKTLPVLLGGSGTAEFDAPQPGQQPR